MKKESLVYLHDLSEWVLARCGRIMRLPEADLRGDLQQKRGGDIEYHQEDIETGHSYLQKKRSQNKRRANRKHH